LKADEVGCAHGRWPTCRLGQRRAGALRAAKKAHLQPAPGGEAQQQPDTAQPERLQARAWLEAADGRVIAMAANRCP
jgi:hypothetical protein